MLPFFIFVFKFFGEIYKEFLVYLIARLNLAINERSEKFWYGINDKASVGEYGKESGREWGCIENLGVYEWWRNWGILVV